MGTTQGFRYFNQDGDECPISVINLMTISKSEFEAAEQFLSDASQKLKSVVVCRQVAEHVKTGINSIRKSSGDGDTSKARKLTIRLVSSHGLEHFTSSVPLRYKASEEGQDPIERDICDTLKSWPFNVFINICTWISPTNLRKLAASNNIKHFAEWCLSPPILLQNQKIPVDVSDRGFSLFGETPMWPLFYQGELSSRRTRVELSDHIQNIKTMPDQRLAPSPKYENSPLPLSMPCQKRSAGVGERQPKIEEVKVDEREKQAQEKQPHEMQAYRLMTSKIFGVPLRLQVTRLPKTPLQI